MHRRVGRDAEVHVITRGDQAVKFALHKMLLLNYSLLIILKAKSLLILLSEFHYFCNQTLY